MVDSAPDTVSASRPWLKYYPQNIPAEIGPLPCSTLAELFEQSCRSFADKTAFICMGRAMTYAEIDRHSAKVAAWLQSRGLVKGDRVAVMLPNILQYPIVVLGIL